MILSTLEYGRTGLTDPSRSYTYPESPRRWSSYCVPSCFHHGGRNLILASVLLCHTCVPFRKLQTSEWAVPPTPSSPTERSNWYRGASLSAAHRMDLAKEKTRALVPNTALGIRLGHHHRYILDCQHLFLSGICCQSSTSAYRQLTSPKVSTAVGDEVLISSRNCGFLNDSLAEVPLTNGDLQTYLSYYAEIVVASAAYVQQCYGNNMTAQGCSFFAKKDIAGSVSYNSSCPFPGKDRICLRDSTNLRVDTGLINSHNDLGFNSPPQDRVGYRQVAECAPLVTEKYTRTNNITVQDPSGPSLRTYIEYLYGATVPDHTFTLDPGHITFDVYRFSVNGVFYIHPTVDDWIGPMLNQNGDYTIA